MSTAIDARPVCSAGVDLIKAFEGYRSKAYLCPAGRWTVGFGHTGPDVRQGMVVDLAQATRLLQADLFKFRAATETLLGNHSATDNEFAAMVSLCYNVGADNFRTSSVLREHCAGRRINAADAFRLWNKARVNGVLTVLAGLTSRREAERSLYLTRNTGT